MKCKDKTIIGGRKYALKLIFQILAIYAFGWPWIFLLDISQLLVVSEMLLSQRWSLPFLHFICEMCCFHKIYIGMYLKKTLILCFYVKQTKLGKINQTVCFHLYEVQKQFQMWELSGKMEINILSGGRDVNYMVVLIYQNCTSKIFVLYVKLYLKTVKNNDN